ncbi:6906_t:CDS:2 [Dentiscutata erythropus]|uniref:6906_t:CDS:1 n=1 Tax=Dentiscutata erythropus TaxID=1348616 RepID=A0A9N9H678_9GLOM|nr:6906_t:CDS:2 [Dentiscutata erythropus]
MVKAIQIGILLNEFYMQHILTIDGQFCFMKTQIAVVERDYLPIFESVNTEIYSEDKKSGKVDNRNSIEQPSINLASHTLRIVKDCLIY